MAQVKELMGAGVPDVQAKLLGDVLSTGLAAAGTTQGAGTAIRSGISVFSTLTASSVEAATLVLEAVGKPKIVVNAHATAALKIFPQSGAAINAGAADAVYSLAAGKTVILIPVSTTQWYAVLTA